MVPGHNVAVVHLHHLPLGQVELHEVPAGVDPAGPLAGDLLEPEALAPEDGGADLFLAGQVLLDPLGGGDIAPFLKVDLLTSWMSRALIFPGAGPAKATSPVPPVAR